VGNSIFLVPKAVDGFGFIVSHILATGLVKQDQGNDVWREHCNTIAIWMLGWTRFHHVVGRGRGRDASASLNRLGQK